MPDLKIFFVTNRNVVNYQASPWFGSRFNADGAHALRFGTAWGKKQDDDTYPYVVDRVEVAPEKLTQEGSGDRTVGSQKIFDALRKMMSGSRARDTLVLIHGYASTFETSLQRGLQLADIYKPGGKSLNVVVFSWPANGQMVPYMSYFSDRNDVRDSGEAMARAFLIFNSYNEQLKAADRCERLIHLIAHSMGNYAFRHGLQALRRRLGDELPRLFSQIVLAAADEDDDAFDCDHKLRLLPNLGRRVTVYFAPQDRALVISDHTKGNPDRLGSDGPKQISGLPTKVVLIDSREVALHGDVWTAHQYYRTSPRVVADVTATLAGTPVDQVEGRTHVPDLRAWRIDA